MLKLFHYLTYIYGHSFNNCLGLVLVHRMTEQEKILDALAFFTHLVSININHYHSLISRSACLVAWATKRSKMKLLALNYAVDLSVLSVDEI